MRRWRRASRAARASRTTPEATELIVLFYSHSALDTTNAMTEPSDSDRQRRRNHPHLEHPRSNYGAAAEMVVRLPRRRKPLEISKGDRVLAT